MKRKLSCKGFTLLEILVAVAVFLIFAIGVYSGLSIVFKIVYQSRMKILETAILSEELEVVRNLEYDDIGILNGVPSGVLSNTKTVTRNGADFEITTTVRNIDDSFDGLAGGDPDDTSPADRKLVEMSITCATCSQQESVVLSTVICPEGLEGASENGSLFINVFDADGLAVSGATVNVVNTDAGIDITDTTDNDGWLKIIDTPTGTLAYGITVSKSGYSSDYTVESSLENPNPSKLPSNIVSQTVTEIYFSIDELGSMSISSMDPSCSALGSMSFNVHGEKEIGDDPVVYKYDGNLTTDGSGNYSISNVEWDTYHFTASGTPYDLAGSIPMSPFDLSPGQSQSVSLILTPHTTNSLLVNVRDSGTKLPLSNSTVRLYKVGYDQTVVTDLGYVRQTDWSGGAGQVDFVEEDEYFSDDGNVEINSPAGDLELDKVGGDYLSSGWLESSTFDLGTTVDFHNIIWEPLSQPTQTGSDSILFQIASTNSSTPSSWDFVGPDGTNSTYYSTTETSIHSSHDNTRYFRYRVFLETDDTDYTPTLSEVAFTYTNSCIPPGQAFFNSLSAGTYTLEISRSGYTSNSGEVEIEGNTDSIVDMSVSE